jgi:xanthine dehydrogenase accessory factor
MRETLARVAELEREGRRSVVATVVRTHGSTPQIAGARLVVDDQGGLSGTLGGGCVEGDAISEARRLLKEGGSSLRAYDLTEPLAWDTGLVCGGTMWIQIEPAREAFGGDLLGRLQARLAEVEGPPMAFGTRIRLEGRSVVGDGHCLIERETDLEKSAGVVLTTRARELLADAFSRGVPRLIPIADGRELLIEPVVARPRLVIAGGGHVALAIASMAQQLDYAITVIDDRPEFASAERFPGIEVIEGDIAATLAGLDIGWNTFIVVATRGHKMDAHCVRAAAATAARYVGLLGSQRKTVLIARMLREEGIGEDRLRAIHAPIGLDLGGRTPGEIALSVLAEMSQERFGGSGRPLRMSDERLTKAIASRS